LKPLSQADVFPDRLAGKKERPWRFILRKAIRELINFREESREM